MKGEVKERWMELCQQAAVEQDPARMLELVSEINDILEAKQKRLSHPLPWEDTDGNEQQPLPVSAEAKQRIHTGHQQPA